MTTKNKSAWTKNEYFQILFALWGYGLTKPILNTSVFLNPSKLKLEVVNATKAVIDSLGFRVDSDLKTQNFDFVHNFTGQRLAEALFLRMPFIKVSEIHY